MLFPNLEIEADVQLNDRTRLSAIKSFAGKDETIAIDTVTIQPGGDASAISVYNATDSNQWFLDWEFKTWLADIDASNNKIDFTEGGVDKVATLTPGNYSLANLLTQIKTQLDSAGTGTFTVTSALDKITISSTGSFGLKPQSGANREQSALIFLGFKKDSASEAATATGQRVEYLPRKVTATINNTTTATSFSTFINVYSEKGDYLFASDSDLQRHETDILRYVDPGRNTFKNVHRNVQRMILDWLNKNGYADIYDEKFDKFVFVDMDEIREWAKYSALKTIFQGIKNDENDVFQEKYDHYAEQEKVSRQRALLRLDVDKDGKIDVNEGVRVMTGDIFVR